MSVRNKQRMVAAAGASLALGAAMVGATLTSASAPAWAASAGPGLERSQQAGPAAPPVPKPDGNGRRWWPGGESVQQRQEMHQAYLNALAGRLGISVDQLSAAMKQARIDLVNKAVADGKLDQERANRIIQAIQSGGGPGQPWMGPRFGPEGQQGPGGPGGPHVVADLLGLTPQQLWTELQSGKSLAQVAEAKGVSRDTLKAKILEAQKARLDAAVAAGRITAEQAQQATARMTANIDRMLDATPGQRRMPGSP